MRPRLTEFLQCPECSSPLDLRIYHEVREPTGMTFESADRDQYKKDVREGTLACDNCRRVYPVVDGVPRMYRNAWRGFGRWRAMGRKDLSHARIDPVPEPPGVVRSRRSFSWEWRSHRPGDATWIWQVRERLAFFSEEVGRTASELRHQSILDAGCGNGELTDALAAWQTEVVGLDLSDSVVRAEQRRSSPRVHYVQGDLLYNPLRRERFNLIYSSGVLHHTPDPRGSFGTLVKLLLPGGRIYIWLYGAPDPSELETYTNGRKRDYWLKPYIIRLPGALQQPIIYLLAARTWARNRLRGPDRALTFARALVGCFDSHTPFYRSHHHFGEIEQWFLHEGLRGVTLSGVREPGFGVFGDLL